MTDRLTQAKLDLYRQLLAHTSDTETNGVPRQDDLRLMAMLMKDERVQDLWARYDPADEPDNRNCLIITGNPVDGFNFIGPFKGYTAAQTFVESIRDSWWIDFMKDPEN
jgi:hypothetical protein